ncbi:uncharacterized protein [Bombus fervidus]|uniref:uncharacterized protein n=1 Tax=Bombus fervidus TaxID=203811 RepID=UPI003AB505D8
MKTMFAVVLATVFLAFVSATPECPSNQEDVVLIPNPNDCASYYSCDGGVAYLMNCSVGLLFNPELRVCDWADNVTCSVTTSTVSNEVTLPNTTPSEESNEVLVEEPSKEPSKELNEESSEETDEDIIKKPNTEPCKASSESSESSESNEESDEQSIYK